MTLYTPVTGTSDSAAVGAAATALGGSLESGRLHVFASSTNCWIKQGTTKLVTCVTKANFADTDYINIAITYQATAGVTYEFDTAGNGVTAGRVQVNISADTTAATCAARLRTAILANQPSLTVTDNADGTLTITAPDKRMTITETVANAGFLVAAAIVPVTAADGSMYVPANVQVIIDGTLGPQLGVIRNTADGSASLTTIKKV